MPEFSNAKMKGFDGSREQDGSWGEKSRGNVKISHMALSENEKLAKSPF